MNNKATFFLSCGNCSSIFCYNKVKIIIEDNRVEQINHPSHPKDAAFSNQ